MVAIGHDNYIAVFFFQTYKSLENQAILLVVGIHVTYDTLYKFP